MNIRVIARLAGTGAIRISGIGSRRRVVNRLVVTISGSGAKFPSAVGDFIDFPNGIIGVVGEVLQNGFEVLQQIGARKFGIA